PQPHQLDRHLQPSHAPRDPQHCRHSHRRDPEASGRQRPQGLHRRVGGGQGLPRRRGLLARLWRATTIAPHREGGAQPSRDPHPAGPDPRRREREGRAYQRQDCRAAEPPGQRAS
ncbi:hypothetical protein BN1723_020295, partial [Verticillium longisporum]